MCTCHVMDLDFHQSFQELCAKLEKNIIIINLAFWEIELKNYIGWRMSCNVLITADRLVKAVLFSVAYTLQARQFRNLSVVLTNKSYLKSQNVPRPTILRQTENISPLILRLIVKIVVRFTLTLQLIKSRISLIHSPLMKFEKYEQFRVLLPRLWVLEFCCPLQNRQSLSLNWNQS